MTLGPGLRSRLYIPGLFLSLKKNTYYPYILCGVIFFLRDEGLPHILCGVIFLLRDGGGVATEKILPLMGEMSATLMVQMTARCYGHPF